MKQLVGQYYFLLRSLFRTKPDVRLCLKRCRHCRIFFLTHRRNIGRHDVGCPFGCREAHRKRESTRRSVEYYRNHPGKKSDQNAKRPSRASVGPSGLPEENPSASITPEPAKLTPQLEAGRSKTCASPPQQAPCPSELAQALPKAQDPDLIEHVRVVVSAIERRPISRPQIWEMLCKFLRQHSMGRRRKIDQTLSWFKANPP